MFKIKTNTKQTPQNIFLIFYGKHKPVDIKHLVKYGIIQDRNKRKKKFNNKNA